MTDQLLNKILENSFTLHELRLRTRILKAFLGKKLYGNDTPGLEQEIAAQTEWLNSLGEEFFTQFGSTNFSQIFEELEKKIESLPVLVVYFAIDPTLDQLHKVGSWLRASYGPLFIFDSKYDPNLIAGCALVWKGIYKDYSLKSKIAQNRDAILEVIKGGIQGGVRQ